MNSQVQNHIVVVEAYEGSVEFLSDEPEERALAIGLGLPLEEIAAALDCRITILRWNEWFRYEADKTWVPVPATRPVSQLDFSSPLPAPPSSRVRRVRVPARDPEYGLPIDEKGLSPRSHGLINDSGLLSFLSYCLDKELLTLFREDPFQAVILPMWGGIGYVSQMARATLAHDVIDVPFVVVVTDVSTHRQMANQEGMWTRQAIVRRQMEDISLALADLVLVFGPRGTKIATAGRMPDVAPPVCTPRFVDSPLLDRIAKAAMQPTNSDQSVGFFLYEPQQASSGVLTALDALVLLASKGVRLDWPMISAGPSMIFAPMRPREFQNYWSSRGVVRELIRERQWEWKRTYPHRDQVFPVRLYPSLFDHLPNIWAELARGSLVLLSPAAAEGLAPGATLPEEVLIQGDPTPESVADCLERIAGSDVQMLDQIRRELCARVVAAHQGEERLSLLRETTAALKQMLHLPPHRQDLSRAALLFLDRHLSLRALAQNDNPPPLPNLRPGTRRGALSVVVTCYEMGPLVKEAVESVWASERHPDELLLVNDGSHGVETLANIRRLEQIASETGLPLEVIRQRNRGLAAARNAGLEAASGEFISFLDGDDVIEPGFYRIALHVLKQHPRLGGVGAWASIFGSDMADGYWNAPQPELPFLFIENSVIVPCLMRTELLRELGGYDVRLRYNFEDWELAIRMLGAGWPIVTIPRHLLNYRVRGHSLLRSMTCVQNQVMRELMLTTHRETVARFAVEIAMQLENQWKQYVYPADRPVVNSNRRPPRSQPDVERSVLQTMSKRYRPFLSRPIKNLVRKAQRVLDHLSAD
jgi:hypothetical protein